MLAPLFLALSVAANPVARQNAATSPIAGFVVPPPRGWNYEQASVGPCGGFAPTNNHTYWGMRADFLLTVANDISDVRLSFSKSGDMSDSVLFGRIAKATAGQICLDDPVDFAALGLTRSDEITVQLAYHDDVTGSEMYNCADIALTSDHADREWNIQCRNTSYIHVEQGESGSGSGSVSKQKVSPLAAGWIGACVTLAVVGLLALALKFGGCLFFNRSSYNRAKRRSQSRQFDDNSSDISLNTRPSMQKQPVGI
ncbi:hypothetical protein CC85DRAFT_282372 [Cutaneotrichosporon oleaginosum]|uniref:Copper acquisition factor BIM1-like domain-containing protein n=1 Tax=Cutaneotrichosporon oleaginosum TaxID=879819 RepID=A0A0J0XXE3_9TREE|nr:uncharacterized protein CC85DRAFT_282372 [Cutaneotrichosporon oleaginosum]KLT45742.1 hypothetical protein CC85DRAFT_282372 [Cutaneotrichosporon oleaginosum]TXT04491.1 hypothetical protein COLE_07310 [Cutaneotrichosporon oleaginosum]